MIQSPSYVARSQVLLRLADPTLGFNPIYASLFGSYSGAQAMTIRWDGSKPLNMLQAKIGINDVVGSSSTQFPLVCLFATIGTNTNQQKFQTFAGPVRVGLRFFLSYKGQQALPSFEGWPDAVEAAVYTVINGPATQNWPMPLVYNGLIGHDRGDVVFGGQGWLQAIYFQITFDVVEV